MTRSSEFSAKTKDQAFARACGRCEMKVNGIRCDAPLVPGNTHYDHILPLALGGTSELVNCQALCTPHHSQKTAKEDVPRIRKADRQRRNHIGAAIKGGKLATASPGKRATTPPTKLAHGMPAWARRITEDA